MKKYLYSFIALFTIVLAFSSCEDVPEPYNKPVLSEPVVEEPKGSGTLEDPYNAVGASQYTSTLDADAKSPNNIYIKGIIVQIKESFNSYGNATFYIADSEDSKTKFYVYRALGLGNKNCTDPDAIKVGDEVVVCGKVTNYSGNTPETVQKEAYIYSINGKTEAGTTTPDNPTPTTGTPTGDGTQANPFNSVAANAYTSALASGAESENEIYIKGKVVSVKEQYGTQYGNATFYISDDGTAENQFYVFRALYLGNEKYTAGETLSPGDEVVVCGKVTNYMGNTPETVQGKAYLYSLKKGEGGSGNGDTPIVPEADNILENGNFEAWSGGLPVNWKSASTASNATLSQSTDAHSGSFAVMVGNPGTANKRLAYKEITLPAGTYEYSLYAKSTTGDPSQCQLGWVPVTDGKVGNYNYLGYESINNTAWTLITKEFTLSAETTLCIVVMNPKGSSYATAQDILIDDVKLIKK